MTPRSCYLDVHGLRIHARTAGRGIDVILVHGLIASHRYWEPTLRRLAMHCRVWVPDLPDHGLSDHTSESLDINQRADLLAAWMDTARITRAHVIGNSAGCQVAAALADRHAERVDRLVLQGPTGEWQGHVLRYGARWARAMMHEPFLPWKTGLQDARDMGLARSAKELQLLVDDDMMERLPRIRAATLVVRGDKDPISPQQWTEKIVDRLPNGRLVVVPAAHIMNMTQHDLLVDTVLPFLGIDPVPASTPV